MSRGLPLATIDQIIDLVGKGMRQIDVASEIGLTPGQVAGTVFRARVAMGHVPRPRVKGEKVRKLPRPQKPLPAPISAAIPSGGAGPPSKPSAVLLAADAPVMRQETVRARTLTGIPPARTCQWIAGDPSADDACKCGAPSVAGFSYCAPHLARAYQPTRRTEDGQKATSIEEWNRSRQQRIAALVS